MAMGAPIPEPEIELPKDPFNKYLNQEPEAPVVRRPSSSIADEAVSQSTLPYIERVVSGLVAKALSGVEKGEDGRGLKDVRLNAKGELIVEFSDGASKNLGRATGEDGVTRVVMGGNSGGGVSVKEDGTSLGHNFTSLNFVGGDITATRNGGDVDIAFNGSFGTVTSVSVTTANGISGTVATATTTPAITLDISGLDAAKIADGSVSNTEFQYINGVTSAIQTQLDAKVDENAAIVGATKTKITYDTKGLVTSGADATTADITDSLNKRYVTDAQLTVIGNTSGTNTGDQDLSGYVPYSGATGNVNLGTHSLYVHSVLGDATDGLLLKSNNGTLVGTLGAANTTNVTWAGSHNYDAATASTIASFGASKTLESLALATYPSLTELSYVKGVTSAIQTQINGKQASDSTLTALAAFNTNGLLTQTAADTFAGRTLTGGGGITVTNGDGVSGNPTLSVSQLKTLWIPAAAMRPSSSGGCAALALVASAANQPDISSLDFDSTTAEYAQFSVRFPKGWDEGTVTAIFHWSHAATTTNFGVRWGLQGVAVSDDDTIAVAYGTAQEVTDTGGTTNDLYVSAATSAITIAGTPAAGDQVFFRAYRDPANGGDTMAIDARLMGITVLYTINTMDDT
jgi:hypothetical protein